MTILILVALAVLSFPLGYGVGRLPYWTTSQGLIGLAITLVAITAIGYEPITTAAILLFLGLGFLTAR